MTLDQRDCSICSNGITSKSKLDTYAGKGLFAMESFWMVRAGEGGRVADEFRQHNAVAMDFEGQDLTNATTREALRPIIDKVYADRKPGFRPIALGSWYKFRSRMKIGDNVMSYDPAKRVYLLGRITGDYEFRPGLISDHEQVRRVEWLGEINRDELSKSVRNTLGSTVAIFEPGEAVLHELRQKLSQKGSTGSAGNAPVEVTPFPPTEAEQIRRDVIGRSHEFIKDEIAQLDWEEMQELVAGVLRAMGFKTRVSDAGPDRGKDIVASPDGLGLSPPRIKVEVKHRSRTPMGASDVRSFLGGLRGEDRGLYVSTGGFTREAQYEAERASVPVHLIDLDLLAQLLVQNYEHMDNEGKAIVPLIRFYWPAGLD